MGKDIKRIKQPHKSRKQREREEYLTEVYNFLPDDMEWTWSNEERLKNIEALERGSGRGRRHSKGKT